MKKIGKYLYLIPLFLFGGIIVSSFIMAFFSAGSIPEYKNTPVTTDNPSVTVQNLYIDAVVNDDNSVNITESFDVTFKSSLLTEVIRFIPYASYRYTTNNDGVQEKELLISRITNARGETEHGEDFRTYTDEQTGFVTFGFKNSEYFKLGETRSYSISYTFDMGKDTAKGYDQFYYNLVGQGTSSSIKNVSFKITLPEDKIKAQSVEMYTGYAGSQEEFLFTQTGNVITGNINELGAFEALTIRVLYKDGVFKVNTSTSWTAIVSLLISLVIIGLTIVAFIKVKKKKNEIIPVELVVPKGVNPYIAEFYNSRKCSFKSAIASIVELANRGYVSLNEYDEGKIEVVKKRPIDDKIDETLSRIYKSLFIISDNVKLEDLDETFVSGAMGLQQKQNNKLKKKSIDKNVGRQNLIYKIVAFVLMLVNFVFMCLTVGNYFGFFSELFSSRFILLVFFFIIMMALMFVEKFKIINIVINTLIISLTVVMYVVYKFNVVDPTYLILISIILSCIGFMMLGLDVKYNEKATKERARVLGFKNYIKKCEVEEIKRFAVLNPNIYFDVLPYAYVFDLSDAWIKKLEVINVQPPEWMTSYVGTRTWSISSFNHSFNSFSSKSMSSYASAVRTHSGGGSSGGGGSFGGGGSSGGGGGGGGFGAR